MVGPWIGFFPALFGKKRKLSDIEYLAIKEFGGKVVENESTRTTAGTVATLTASAGKDMYLAKAKISVRQTVVNQVAKACIVELRVNGIVKETFSNTFHDGSATGTPGVLSIPYEFVIQGLKVAATQLIVLEVPTLDTNQEINGTLECWQENTGATPQVPSI